MASFRMRIIPAVIGQHAEEAAILWLLRTTAVRAPHYDLKDIAKLDGRVNAHLDGLRIAGQAGWEVCQKELSFEEEGEMFVAVCLAVDSGGERCLSAVLEKLEQIPHLVDAFVAALTWGDTAPAARFVSAFANSTNPLQRQIGIAASAILRGNPGPALLDATRDQNACSRARAVKALGELGTVDRTPIALAACNSENPEVRFAAAWSAALLANSANALSILQVVATGRGRAADEAAMLVARRLAHAHANAWHRRLAEQPQHRRLAIFVAGQVGDPESMSWLIEQMIVPELARVAGEAFTSITGVGIDYRDLDGPKPEGFESGPTDDPKDENVEMDPDENLPWPDPVKVAAWWDQHRGEFQNGTRYLCGKPISIEWCKTVLRDGFQRQRAAAALELAILQPGTPLFNVKAPGFRQIELLGKPQGPIR
jgi:uncharacterized protein (TIGR02270 family)